jgi:hypothetical protein
MKTNVAGTLLGFLLLTAPIGIASPASAQPMYGGDTLSYNDTRYSANGQYKIEWRCTYICGVVHLRYVNGEWIGGYGYIPTIWDQGDWVPYFYAPPRMEMQTDGNLVYYDVYDVAYAESNTDGHSGAWLNIQDDGNVVIYTWNNVPIWSLW